MAGCWHQWARAVHACAHEPFVIDWTRLEKQNRSSHEILFLPYRSTMRDPQPSPPSTRIVVPCASQLGSAWHSRLLRAAAAVPVDGPAAHGAVHARKPPHVVFAAVACDERDYKGLHAFPSNITRDGPPITRDYTPSLLKLQGMTLQLQGTTLPPF